MFPCVNLANGPWEYVFPNHPTEIQNYYYMVHYFLVYVSGSHTDIFSPTAQVDNNLFIYYRFIARFSIGWDFLFITFLLHLFLSCCCCLATPPEKSNLPACGPPASFSVHSASSAVTLAWSVYESRGDNGVGMWVQLKRCVSCVCYRGDIVVMAVDLASTLCKYDLRKGDLFVLSWKRVRRVRWGSMLMCGGGVQSMLLLHLVAR